jgi:hypothetical protein
MIDAPQVQLQANVNYTLLEAPMSVGMSRDEVLLGKITNLKYMDHEITDAHEFP